MLYNSFSSLNTPMNFSDFKFRDHKIKGATIAQQTMPNGWVVSIVAGPKDSGLYGVIGEDTFEVAIIQPNGNILKDVIPYQTPTEISTIMRVISMMDNSLSVTRGLLGVPTMPYNNFSSNNRS